MTEPSTPTGTLTPPLVQVVAVAYSESATPPVPWDSPTLCEPAVTPTGPVESLLPAFAFHVRPSIRRLKRPGSLAGARLFVTVSVVDGGLLGGGGGVVTVTFSSSQPLATLSLLLSPPYVAVQRYVPAALLVKPPVVL